MLRTIITATALTLACMSTQGCAVLLTGYLVGKSMSDDKAEKACRENLRITNEQRQREGKDLFPDQCGR